MEKELVVYQNKFGTPVRKMVPTHHLVNRVVEKRAVKRANEIIKIDKRNLAAHKARLAKTIKMHMPRERG
jgi:hypothetical protein